MSGKRTYFFVLLLALLTGNLHALCQYNNIEFVENKGQWHESIKFRGDISNGTFYLQQKGFKVVQSKPEDLMQVAQVFHGELNSTSANALKQSPTAEPKVVVHSHAYDVVFLNAQEPEITGDKPLDTYNNYFIGNDATKWKGNCRIFQAIEYKNMYPGIEVRYYTNSNTLKYDIVVQAGADLSKLALQYIGTNGIEVRSKELVVKTSVGEMRELAPYAYQVIDGVKREVYCRFKVAGNVVRFVLDDYAKDVPLIIDPTLVFCTFTGSAADNWGYTATYGSDGSFYSGGIVFGNGFKVSTGAFETVYQGGVDDSEGIGGFDIGIMKFTPDGRNRVYATYLGGGANEYPHSIIVDAGGNLVIGGRTTSGDSYPHTRPALGPGGSYDIVLTKLNATGTALIGSVRIGGSNYDGVNIAPKYVNQVQQPALSLRRNYGDDSRSEVIIDAAGNILLASNTQSSNFPVVGNNVQSALAGGQDAVVIKASPDLSTIIFSTLLGGSANDAAFVLSINPLNGNIYIGGNTESNNLPGDKTGVLQSTAQGGTDGFVSILTPDGSTIVKTSYFGTGANDMLYGIQFDKFGFPYIMGTTTGSWPVMNAAFSQTGGKQFISKLRPDLSAYIYSTVFGTNTPFPNISPVAFLVDRCENVYVSGWGGNVDNTNYPNAGTTGLSVKGPNIIQPNTDGSDFYFFVLERNATSQLYGSFFGQNGGTGEHVDGGTSRFDANGVIYQAMCANCYPHNYQFPTTPGVWSPNNPSPNCNLGAVKIAFNLSGIAGSVRSSIAGSSNDTTGCIPLTVNFKDTLAQGQRYMWSFGDGSAQQTTTIPSINHTFNAVGDYFIRLISIDSSKCNISDTAYTHIRVRTFKAFIDFTARKLLPCQELKYEFTNLSTVVPAARPFTDSSFLWNFGDNTAPVRGGLSPIQHSFPAPGTYRIILRLTDTNFCNAPIADTMFLRIANNVTAHFLLPKKGCAPLSAEFTNISDGGQQFLWNFGDGGTSTAPNPTHIYTTAGVYHVSLHVVDSATCNVTSVDTASITVFEQPVANFFYTPNPPEVNTAVDFVNTSTGATQFLWKFGDGDFLNVATMETVEHLYNKTDTFTTCLTASNAGGCRDTICKPLFARIASLLDVPNAFTPNGDGTNDKIYVRGFGIGKMVWRIYNRWGRMVFETHNRFEGWDGKYNGEDQPMEVYHYVLVVIFTDKTTYQKKGDITLLR